MHSEKRLPGNGKEACIFMLTVSIISVNIIAPLIMGMEHGFSLNNYLNTLRIIPFLWIAVLLLVNFVSRPLVSKLVMKFIAPTDSFNARVLFNILFSVSILSVLLTVIGSWIGRQEISMDPLYNFFHIWPRNFFIAFWVEMIIAQPIARKVMLFIHK
jgi:hypothetical protein